MHFLDTPSHGYLVVHRFDLSRENFIPSGYSFHSAESAYLEEDCDAPAFVKISGIDIHAIKGIHGELPSGLQNYPKVDNPSYKTVN